MYIHVCVLFAHACKLTPIFTCSGKHRDVHVYNKCYGGIKGVLSYSKNRRNNCCQVVHVHSMCINVVCLDDSLAPPGMHARMSSFITGQTYPPYSALVLWQYACIYMYIYVLMGLCACSKIHTLYMHAWMKSNTYDKIHVHCRYMHMHVH